MAQLAPPRTGLVAWLSARFAGGVSNPGDWPPTASALPSDGTRLDTWPEIISGNASSFEADPGAPLTRPIFRTSRIHSHPTLDFSPSPGDGVRTLGALSGLPLPGSGSSFEIVLICRDVSVDATVVAPPQVLLCAVGALGTTGEFAAAGVLYDGAPVWGVTCVAESFALASSPPPSGAFVAMVQYVSGGPLLVLRSSADAFAAELAAQSGAIDLSSGQGLILAPEGATFELAEVLIYDRVTAAEERTALRAYLRDVWGIGTGDFLASRLYLAGVVPDAATSVPAPHQNLRVAQGADVEIAVDIRHGSPPQAFDAGACVATLSVKRTTRQSGTTPGFVLTGTIDPDVAGRVVFALPSEDTAALAPGGYVYDVWLEDGANRVQIVPLSTLVIEAVATRPA